jgi:hypothetical protein
MTDTQDTAERDEKRRTVLQSLQLQPAEPGRLAEGLKDTDRVLVATFNNPVVAHRLQKELSELKIKSWVKSDGLKTAIEVTYRDRQLSFERLADFRRRVPDDVPAIRRKPYDFAMLGATLGAVAGVIALRFTFPLAIFVWVGFVANGLFLGYVIDPGRRLRRNGVPGQFSLVDLMLLTAAVAVLFASGNYLVEAIAQLSRVRR